jgi:hypothetical protein
VVVSISPEPDPAPESTVTSGGQRPMRVPVLRNSTILAAGAVLAVIGGVLVWLLLAFVGGSDHQDLHEAQLDAIKTAGTIVVGTGGAAALCLTARRQRTSEIALNQKADDQAAVDREFALKEAQARAAEADAEARRITEQYGRAADQLGSDKAAVRLAGLYALERLAQDNPSQRATIVAVLCAYLRMPYELPGDKRAADTTAEVRAEFQARTQEREIRLTAQRILATHLRPGDDPGHPVVTFWADTVLDLTGAILIDLNLTGCRMTALFNGARFIGDARFHGARFAGEARFSGATFTGEARFGWARFTGDAGFDFVTFIGDAWFSQATFTSTAGFARATFTSTAWFDRVTFTGHAWFDFVTFTGNARFSQATFTDAAGFGRATFTGEARFELVTITGNADFDGTTFTDDVQARVLDGAWAALPRPHPGDGWPSGWSVRPKADHPAGLTNGTWGVLVFAPPTA